MPNHMLTQVPGQAPQPRDDLLQWQQRIDPSKLKQIVRSAQFQSMSPHMQFAELGSHIQGMIPQWQGLGPSQKKSIIGSLIQEHTPGSMESFLGLFSRAVGAYHSEEAIPDFIRKNIPEATLKDPFYRTMLVASMDAALLAGGLKTGAAVTKHILPKLGITTPAVVQAGISRGMAPGTSAATSATLLRGFGAQGLRAYVNERIATDLSAGVVMGIADVAMADEAQPLHSLVVGPLSMAGLGLFFMGGFGLVRKFGSTAVKNAQAIVDLNPELYAGELAAGREMTHALARHNPRLSLVDAGELLVRVGSDQGSEAEARLIREFFRREPKFLRHEIGLHMLRTLRKPLQTKVKISDVGEPFLRYEYTNKPDIETRIIGAKDIERFAKQVTAGEIEGGPIRVIEAQGPESLVGRYRPENAVDPSPGPSTWKLPPGEQMPEPAQGSVIETLPGEMRVSRVGASYAARSAAAGRSRMGFAARGVVGPTSRVSHRGQSRVVELFDQAYEAKQQAAAAADAGDAQLAGELEARFRNLNAEANTLISDLPRYTPGRPPEFAVEGPVAAQLLREHPDLREIVNMVSRGAADEKAFVRKVGQLAETGRITTAQAQELLTQTQTAIEKMEAQVAASLTTRQIEYPGVRGYTPHDPEVFPVTKQTAGPIEQQRRKQISLLENDTIPGLERELTQIELDLTDLGQVRRAESRGYPSSRDVALVEAARVGAPPGDLRPRAELQAELSRIRSQMSKVNEEIAGETAALQASTRPQHPQQFVTSQLETLRDHQRQLENAYGKFSAELREVERQYAKMDVSPELLPDLPKELTTGRTPVELKQQITMLRTKIIPGYEDRLGRYLHQGSAARHKVATEEGFTNADLIKDSPVWQQNLAERIDLHVEQLKQNLANAKAQVNRLERLGKPGALITKIPVTPEAQAWETAGLSISDRQRTLQQRQTAVRERISAETQNLRDLQAHVSQVTEPSAVAQRTYAVRRENYVKAIRAFDSLERQGVLLSKGQLGQRGLFKKQLSNLEKAQYGESLAMRDAEIGAVRSPQSQSDITIKFLETRRIDLEASIANVENQMLHLRQRMKPSDVPGPLFQAKRPTKNLEKSFAARQTELSKLNRHRHATVQLLMDEISRRYKFNRGLAAELVELQYEKVNLHAAIYELEQRMNAWDGALDLPRVETIRKQHQSAQLELTRINELIDEGIGRMARDLHTNLPHVEGGTPRQQSHRPAPGSTVSSKDGTPHRVIDDSPTGPVVEHVASGQVSVGPVDLEGRIAALPPVSKKPRFTIPAKISTALRESNVILVRPGADMRGASSRYVTQLKEDGILYVKDLRNGDVIETSIEHIEQLIRSGNMEVWKTPFSGQSLVKVAEIAKQSAVSLMHGPSEAASLRLGAYEDALIEVQRRLGRSFEVSPSGYEAVIKRMEELAAKGPIDMVKLRGKASLMEDNTLAAIQATALGGKASRLRDGRVVVELPLGPGKKPRMLTIVYDNELIADTALREIMALRQTEARIMGIARWAQENAEIPSPNTTPDLDIGSVPKQLALSFMKRVGDSKPATPGRVRRGEVIPEIGNEGQFLGGGTVVWWRDIAPVNAVLPRLGEGGKGLNQMITSAFEMEEMQFGRWSVALDDALGLVDPGSVADGTFARFIETGQGGTPGMVRAWSMIRKVLDDVYEQAESAGLEIPERIERYFPHLLNTIEAAKAGGYRNTIIDKLVKSGAAKTVEEAEVILSKYIRRTRISKAPNIELERLHHSIDYIRDANVAFTMYLRKAARRIAQARSMGVEHTRALSAIDQVARSHGDPGYKYAKLVYDYAVGNEYSGLEGIMGTIYDWQGAKLSLSFLSNATQTLNVAMKTGLSNFVKSIFGTLADAARDPTSMTRQARIVGAISQSMLADLRGGGAGVSGLHIDGVLKQLNQNLVERTLHKTVDMINYPFRVVESFNRAVAVKAGEMYLKDLQATLQRDPMNKIAVRQLELVGLTPSQALAGLSDYTKQRHLLDLVGKRVSDQTQFQAGLMQMPLWQQHPVGRFLMQFKSFSVNQFRFIAHELVDPIKQKDWARVARNYTTVFAAFPVAGGLNQRIREILSEPDPEKAWQAFIADPVMMTTWSGYLGSLVSAGSLGIAADVASSLVEGNQFALQALILPPSSGTFIGVPTAAASGVKAAVNASQSDYNKAMRALLRELGGLGTGVGRRFFPPPE